jgi:CHAT domain-containing protein
METTALSACDTARGDIKIGEGVFGLRRAFAIAGTKILVMSLWEVPGRATALLMEQFFEHYQNGVAGVKALQKAQNYVRNITIEELRKSDLGVEIIKELLRVRELPTQIDGNETSKPLEHPFYWGGWICQG